MPIRVWSISQSTFTPALSKYGQIQIAADNGILSEAMIIDHMARSRGERSRQDYRVEDFSDEIAIYVFSTGRWRKILNLQLEGYEP
jgi:hypothetical protein